MDKTGNKSSVKLLHGVRAVAVDPGSSFRISMGLPLSLDHETGLPGALKHSRTQILTYARHGIPGDRQHRIPEF